MGLLQQASPVQKSENAVDSFYGKNDDTSRLAGFSSAVLLLVLLCVVSMMDVAWLVLMLIVLCLVATIHAAVGVALCTMEALGTLAVLATTGAETLASYGGLLAAHH